MRGVRKVRISRKKTGLPKDYKPKQPAEPDHSAQIAQGNAEQPGPNQMVDAADPLDPLASAMQQIEDDQSLDPNQKRRAKAKAYINQGATT